ncbi:MAG: succinyl-diaminopimelate desuccinylase [Proteobacteria bacterium]|nr:succinyl-diaminopimelate desuccinylase [Pseudomonadota bacterium]
MSVAQASAPAALDPIALAQDLIRCPSVTPADAGALDVLAQHLEALGFTCHKLHFAEPGTADIDNLYARIGTRAPHFCFAGHTDVVPVGRPESWSVDPFGAAIHGDLLFGRGASDMKGAIAAFVAAAERILARQPALPGSISFLITGDEEGPAINGTVKMLRWLEARGERIDVCVVGEPTNPTVLGEMAKIGRRGSLNGRLLVDGVQGHVAYPDLADNPVPKLVKLLGALDAEHLDDGTPHFQRSNLEIVTVDVGNPTTNLIPATATAGFNIRFNDLHTGAALDARLRRRLDAVGVPYRLDVSISGEAFLTPPGPLSDLLVKACRAVLGRAPELSTTGGTSDARFIRYHCPVIEFGLVSQTMHKVDERAALSDIRRLVDVYAAMLEDFLGRAT